MIDCLGNHMEPKKKERQLNVRIEPELIEALRGMPVSEYVRQAIKEKLERDRQYKACRACKGIGYIRK